MREITISMSRDRAEWLVRLLEMNEKQFNEHSSDCYIPSSLQQEALFQKRYCEMLRIALKMKLERQSK